METSQIITGYLIFIFLIYFSIIGRLFFVVRPILSNYYCEEKIEWNAKLNPQKLKIYLVLILVATYLTYNAHQKFIYLKSLEKIPHIYFIGIMIGLLYVYVFIENKIRTPSMRYLKTQNEFSSDKNYSEKTIKKSIITASKLNSEELKNKFESGMQKKWFSCEFSQIEEFAYLNEPKLRISWLVPKNKNNTFNVDSILDFIESFSFGNFSVLTNGEIAALSNKYFNYLDSQNSDTFEMKPDNVQKWKTRILKRSKGKNV